MEQEQPLQKSESLIERTRGFAKDVGVEFGKVSWPSRTELRSSTAVVIMMVLMIAAFLFVVDRVLQTTLGLLFR